MMFSVPLMGTTELRKSFSSKERKYDSGHSCTALRSALNFIIQQRFTLEAFFDFTGNVQLKSAAKLIQLLTDGCISLSLEEKLLKI